MKYARSLMTGIMVVFTGCSSASVEDYKDNKPVMDIREYFNGPIEAWGVFLDRSGKADPSFHVAMKGTWKGNNGTFEERFVYSDGHEENRTWTITFVDDSHFTATAHDVKGEAKGQQSGNAVNMRYVLGVKSKGSVYNMSMDDWMFRMDDKTVLNHIVMRKFGFKVGELMITFRKKE